MERKYNLNDLALMTALTTRTLRNYLAQGILHGEKTNGIWQFADADLERFFSNPFVKEGLRIKRSSVVFDFLADRNKKKARSCIILDIPASRKETRSQRSFATRCVTLWMSVLTTAGITDFVE